MTSQSIDLEIRVLLVCGHSVGNNVELNIQLDDSVEYTLNLH